MPRTRALAGVLLITLCGACAVDGPRLHRAAGGGDGAAVDVLLDGGESASRVDDRGRTALHMAADSGDSSVVRRLVEAGAPVDARDENSETALYRAVEKSHVAATRTLLALHANPNIANDRSTTPLMVAADKGRLELVRLLLEAGADPKPRNQDRETALMIAADKRHLAIVDMLLARGADPAMPDRDGMTPLYRAVDQRDIEVTRSLLAAGADPNQASREGRLPLIRALENRDDAIVAALIEHRADPNARSPGREPALVIAARQRDAASVDELIEAGARPDTPGQDARTALLVAVQQHDSHIAEALLEARANPDARDQGGQTPLYYAVAARDHPSVAVLLAGGADPNKRNQNGARPLALAMTGQDTATVELLLAAGAEPASPGDALVDPAGFISRYGSTADARREDVDSAPVEERPAPRMQARLGPIGSARYYSKRVAVVVGIDRYAYWPALEGAGRDARRVARAFEAMGFDHVIEVYDEDATRRRILSVLGTDLAAHTDPDALAVIYFAGHGETESLPGGDRRGYLVPVDADPQQVFATAISMDTLRSISNRLPARQIYYAMDSCYSGLGFTRGISIPRKAGDDYIEKITSMRAVQMITAGAEGEQAIERGGQGVFTRFFLQALDGQADFDGDGWVTASEIGTYVRPHVTTATKSRQTPRYGTLEGSGEVAFSLGAP